MSVTVETVKDYQVSISVVADLKDYKQIAQTLTSDYDFQIENDTVTLVLVDGTEMVVEVHESTITSTKCVHAVFEAYVLVDFEEEGIDVDGAYNRLIKKFRGATIKPFNINTWDWELEEPINKIAISTNAQLSFELVESY